MDNHEHEIQNDQKKDLVNTIENILTRYFKETKKEEYIQFIQSLDSIIHEVDLVVDKGKKENNDLQNNLFTHKMALIAFNGVLLTLMVVSIDTIKFDFLSFVLLFFSIVYGLGQIIVHYFINDYKYTEGLLISKKLTSISHYCKENREDENALTDVKAYFRNFTLGNRKTYSSIPSLINDFDRDNNLLSIYVRKSLIEALFFLPFIIGTALVIFRVYEYIS